MANPQREDEIIREPENYAEMIKKLEERDAEAMERAKKKLGSDEGLLEGAKKELSQLMGRREYTPLSDKEVKRNPTDSHVLQVRDTVKQLSNRIDTAINQNPEAKRALLKGRVTLGKPEGSTKATSA